MAAAISSERDVVMKNNDVEAPSASSVSHLATRLGTTTSGLKQLTEKMVRAALLSRPINGVKFFANFLDAEINRQSLHKLLGENASTKRTPLTSDHSDHFDGSDNRANRSRIISALPEHFAVLRPQVKWQRRPRKPTTNTERSLPSLNIRGPRGSTMPNVTGGYAMTERPPVDNHETSRTGAPETYQFDHSVSFTDEDKLFRMNRLQAKFDAGLALIIDRELDIYRRLGEKMSQQREAERMAAIDKCLRTTDAAVQSDARLHAEEGVLSRTEYLDDSRQEISEKVTATWTAGDSDGRPLLTETPVAGVRLNSVRSDLDRGRQPPDQLRQAVDEQLEDSPSVLDAVDETPDAPIYVLRDEPSVVEARNINMMIVKDRMHMDEESIRRNIVANEDEMASNWAAELPDAPVFDDDISAMELQRYSRYQSGMLTGKERIASTDEDAIRQNIIVDEDELASNWEQIKPKKTAVNTERKYEEAQSNRDDEPSSHALADFDDKSHLVLSLDTLKIIDGLIPEMPSVHDNHETHEEPLTQSLLADYFSAFETEDTSVHALEDAYESMIIDNNVAWVETWSKNDRDGDTLGPGLQEGRGLARLGQASLPNSFTLPDEPSMFVLSDSMEDNPLHVEEHGDEPSSHALADFDDRPTSHSVLSLDTLKIADDLIPSLAPVHEEWIETLGLQPDVFDESLIQQGDPI